MPNHVTTIMRMSPEVAHAFTRTHTEEERAEHEKYEEQRRQRFIDMGREADFTPDPLNMDERFVDFALVIPEPERIFQGGCNGQHPHPHPDGGVYDACWYDWNRNNWGTKWNAYSQEIVPIAGDLTSVKFDTAWAHPAPVIIALAAKFPDEQIDVLYADEDLGNNLGAYSIRGTEVLKMADIEYGSPEAYELASQIHYGKSYAEMKAEWGEDE